MNPLEDLLRTRLGLDPASLGDKLIERTARSRMRRLGMEDLYQYSSFLENSPEDWRELVESVLVTETWFFRDPGAFSTLAISARSRLMMMPATSRLRLLSLPCSSGEEPYSMAMALVDAGVPPERFLIDAADLSTRALEVAEQGTYRNNSFRGTNLTFRTRHFKKTADSYVIDPVLRSRIQFSHFNVLTLPLSTDGAQYDFVFCRNMLIYFDSMAQRMALENISRLLVPDGLMFVGPAEISLAVRHGLVPAQIPMAFACRKGSNHFEQSEVAPRPGNLSLDGSPSERASTRESGLRLQRGVQPEPLARDRKPESELHRILILANQGKLREAVALCEGHLREYGPSAQVYYLLGMVKDAFGDAKAIECYRKALYLDPHHIDSLLQMAVLAQQTGDAAAARNFQRRVQRLKESI